MKKALFTSLIAIAFILTLSLTSANEAYAAERINHTEEDYQIIPDKYNTGADESSLTVVTADDAASLKAMFGGVPFKKSSSNLLTINFHGNGNLSGEIWIENIDFSNMDFGVYNANLCKNQVKIIFSNCKFRGVGMTNSSDLVYYEYRNCTMENINGSNYDLYNCYIGGGQSDGIRAFNNVNIVNCYIADKAQPNGTSSVGNHTDGTQIYGTKDGTCQNIHYINCRFELPQIKDATAYVNACLMLQIEFCDADDITFTDCRVNGGGYAIYAWCKKDQFTLTNAVFQNIAVGCASNHGTIYPRVGKNVTFDNVYDTESLYVGSVWRTGNNVHLSVTNDTNKERTLCVYTNYGEQYFTIDACPLFSEMQNGCVSSFSELPFDLDIEIGDVEWAVCYDITDGDYKQIRFVNYTGQAVYSFDDSFNNDQYATTYSSYADTYYETSREVETVSYVEETTANAGIIGGTCGDKITWSLSEDGTLVVEGTGKIYDYHSGNKAPWTEYNSMITSIIIGEGITKIGNQAFRDCTAVTNVELPSTLQSIGKIAFQKCKSLRNIVLPENLISIGDRCFAADSFETVIYLGNSWDNVNVGDYNEPLTNALAK